MHVIVAGIITSYPAVGLGEGAVVQRTREGVDPPLRYRGMLDEARLPSRVPGTQRQRQRQRQRQGETKQKVKRQRQRYRFTLISILQDEETFPNLTEAILLRDTWPVIQQQVH